MEEAAAGGAYRHGSRTKLTILILSCGDFARDVTDLSVRRHFGRFDATSAIDCTLIFVSC